MNQKNQSNTTEFQYTFKDFISPPDDIIETEQFCYTHKQNYIEQKFSLPSGRMYTSRCDKCVRDENINLFQKYKQHEKQKQEQEQNQVVVTKQNPYATRKCK